MPTGSRAREPGLEEFFEGEREGHENRGAIPTLVPSRMKEETGVAFLGRSVFTAMSHFPFRDRVGLVMLVSSSPRTLRFDF